MNSRPEMFKLLRQLLREHINSVADVEFLSRKIYLNEEIEVTNAKLSIVSNLLDTSETESPRDVSRVISKINYLSTRTQL